MSFSKQISKFTAKAAGNMDNVVRMSFIEMSTRIIRTSPVGDAKYWLYTKPPEGYTGGRFRANWQASVNAPKTGVVDSINAGDSEASVKNAAIIKNQESYWLVNNLDYAKAIEDGRSRRQRPNGVVKLVVAQWKTIVRNVTKLVN